MKLLVISMAGIGDTLFSTPLIHELRANFPQATLDALVLWPGARSLLEGNPHLNTVHQKNLIKETNWAAVRYLLRLRNQHYDVSVNTHPESRIHYRVVAALVGARIRFSHRYDRWGMLDRLLVNQSLLQDYTRHSIENNLAFLPSLGAKATLSNYGYELYLSAGERAGAKEFIQRNKLSGRKRLGIHVGSGGTKNLALRRWPLEHYRELLARLHHAKPDAAVMLFGGPDEATANATLMAQTDRNFVFCPPTENIRQAAALLGECDVFLSVDTALMHLAAAAEVPQQVVIETPTLNKTVEPYQRPFWLVKNPTVHGRNLHFYRYDGRGIRGTPEEILACMKSVSPEDVFQVILRALEMPRRSNASRPA